MRFIKKSLWSWESLCLLIGCVSLVTACSHSSQQPVHSSPVTHVSTTAAVSVEQARNLPVDSKIALFMV